MFYKDSSVRCGQAPCGHCDGHTTQQPRIRQSVQGAQALAKASAAAGATTLSDRGGGQPRGHAGGQGVDTTTASWQESPCAGIEFCFGVCCCYFPAFLREKSQIHQKLKESLGEDPAVCAFTFM